MHFDCLILFLFDEIYTNKIAPDGAPCSAASHVGLYCLPVSLTDAKLIYTNIVKLHTESGLFNQSHVRR